MWLNLYSPGTCVLDQGHAKNYDNKIFASSSQKKNASETFMADVSADSMQHSAQAVAADVVVHCSAWLRNWDVDVTSQ